MRTPPLKPKIESFFSQISDDWHLEENPKSNGLLFIKRSTLHGNRKWLSNRLKIEKLSFWNKFESLADRLVKN